MAPAFEDKGSLKEYLFAAMPPSGGNMLTMAMCSARWRIWLNGEVVYVWKIMFIDVKKAHRYAVCDDEGAYM